MPTVSCYIYHFYGYGRKMTNIGQTIKKNGKSTKHEEKYRGLCLPNIQRYFVWNEEQIEKLLDSIMRE